MSPLFKIASDAPGDTMSCMFQCDMCYIMTCILAYHITKSGLKMASCISTSRRMWRSGSRRMRWELSGLWLTTLSNERFRPSQQ